METQVNLIPFSASNSKTISDIHRYIKMTAKSFGEREFSYTELVERLIKNNNGKDHITIFAGQSNRFISLAKDSPTVSACVQSLVDSKQLKTIKSNLDAFYQNDYEVRQFGVDPSTIKKKETDNKGAA